jgi:hypothetical protein
MSNNKDEIDVSEEDSDEFDDASSEVDFKDRE